MSSPSSPSLSVCLLVDLQLVIAAIVGVTCPVRVLPAGPGIRRVLRALEFLGLAVKDAVVGVVAKARQFHVALFLGVAGVRADAVVLAAVVHAVRAGAIILAAAFDVLQFLAATIGVTNAHAEVPVDRPHDMRVPPNHCLPPRIPRRPLALIEVMVLRVATPSNSAEPCQPSHGPEAPCSP